MGIPRESVRLVREKEGIRMLGVKSGDDFTGAMKHYASNKVKELQAQELHGFILKKDSPSCGMERVRLYNLSGGSLKQGIGMFAETLMASFPEIPVEEEGRLHDLSLRENFVERVFSCYRWKEFLKLRPASKDLVSFHTRNKLSILSHDRAAYGKMGALVARAGKSGLHPTLEEYGSLFTEALKHRATAKKHANVLYHLLGYLKKALDSSDKEEMVHCIEDYRKGLVPLIVPITLLLHHFRRHPHPWVLEQTYLSPYPGELMLRNHV